MADAENLRREEWERQDRQQDAGSGSQGRVDAAGTDKGDMADANGYGSLDDKQHSHGRSSKTVAECRGRISSDHMADADQGGRGRRPHDGDGERDGQAGGRDEDHGVAAGGGEDCLDVAHPGNDRARRDVGAIGDGGRSTLDAGAESLRQTHWQGGSGGSDARSFGDGSFWSDHIWLTGADGKSRRSQPGIPLLAHGIPNRVGRLRAYGNAIVPPLAAEVIKAFMETEA